MPKSSKVSFHSINPVVLNLIFSFKLLQILIFCFDIDANFTNLPKSSTITGTISKTQSWGSSNSWSGSITSTVGSAVSKTKCWSSSNGRSSGNGRSSSNNWGSNSSGGDCWSSSNSWGSNSSGGDGWSGNDGASWCSYSNPTSKSK